MIVGDKCTVKVQSNNPGRKKPKIYTGKIVYIHPEDQYVTVDIGKYKITVLKADRLTGITELYINGQLVKVKEERRVKEVAKTPVIKKELLLEECREHGTNAAAMKVIANKYNVAISTVRNAIYRWDIKLKLQEGKEEQAAALKKEQKDKQDEGRQKKATKETKKTSDLVTEETASTKTNSNDIFEIKYLGFYTAAEAAVVMINTAEMLEGLAKDKEGEPMYRIHLAVSR
jgi:hypothetical protein